MRKIEEAAERIGYTTTTEESCFLAGARYVLDAMTSDEAKDVALGDVDRTIWMPDIEKILSAVRKEIEGE